MQIIVSPVAGGDNFLLDVDASTDVAQLRAAIATKMHSEPSTVKLVCEGLELADGATLAEYFVQPLSTIRVVIAAAGAPAGAEADESQVISDAEMARAIVVTGMPEAEPAATEAAVHQVFSKFGDISRLIFQSDGTGKQHAVLVYQREHSAAAALAAAGQPVLGAPVNVMLANNLASGRGKAGPRPSHASDMVADLLSTGYLFGVQGVAHVKRFDETNGVSTRIKIATADAVTQASAALTNVNRTYKVTESIASTYTSARAQAVDLDSKYQISAKAREAGKVATETAKVAIGAAAATASNLASKAMANPNVASAVTTGLSFFSSATAAASHMVGSAVAQAKADIGNIESKVKEKAAVQGTAAALGLPSGQVPAAAGAAEAAAPAPAPPPESTAAAAATESEVTVTI